MPSFIRSHTVAAGSTQVQPESNALATRDLHWSNSGLNALLKAPHWVTCIRHFQKHHCRGTNAVFSPVSRMHFVKYLTFVFIHTNPPWGTYFSYNRVDFVLAPVSQITQTPNRNSCGAHSRGKEVCVSVSVCVFVSVCVVGFSQGTWAISKQLRYTFREVASHRWEQSHQV